MYNFAYRSEGRYKMKKKLTAPTLVAIISIALLLIAGFCVKNRATTPVILGDRTAPTNAVTGFFDALTAGEYDLCASFVSDYSSLGFDSVPEKESERMIYECLLDSYSYQLLGGVETSPEGVYQRALVTAFDVERLSVDINDRFVSALEEQMNEFDDYSAMFDKDGQYSAALIEATLVDILTELLAVPEYYYTTAELRLELTLTGGEWKLILSEELLSALTGSIGEEE